MSCDEHVTDRQPSPSKKVNVSKRLPYGIMRFPPNVTLIVAFSACCCLQLVDALKLSTAPYQTSSLPQRWDGIRSIIHWEAPLHDQDCVCQNEMESIVSSMVNFDNSHSVQSGAIDTSVDTILERILPPALFELDKLKADMTAIIIKTATLSSPSEMIACRLALINGVRCPKWHEDYVKIRLLKTYLGVGTEWVDPSDMGVRAINCLRSAMDLDLVVNDSRKINRAHVNDILIISGRERDDRSIVPVLHRSPPVVETERRLLFTVTVS